MILARSRPHTLEFPLHLARLNLINFRRHENLCVPLRPITVLLGPNNVGKSAVIDALSLLSTFSKFKPYQFSDRGRFTFDSLARSGGDGTITLEAQFADSLSGSSVVDYSIRFQAESADRTRQALDVLEERLDIRGTSQLERDGKSLAGLKANFLSEYLQNTSVFGAINGAFRDGLAWNDKDVRQAHLLLRLVGQHRMVPHQVAEPGAASPEHGAFPNVHKYGRGLTELLVYLNEFQPDALAQITSDISQAIDGFMGFEFGPADSPQEEQFLARFADTRGATPAFLLSDGTLNLIGLTTALRSPRQFRMLCLEEPELGLTPKSVCVLANVLGTGALTSDGAQPQIVLSTHSPFLVSALLDRFASQPALADQLSVVAIDIDPSTGRSRCRSLETAREELFDSTSEVGPEAISKVMLQMFG